MAKTITTTAFKRILTKGLTGWQAGKLILQDMIDTLLRRDSVLSEADMAAIQRTPMEGHDVRDYNMFIALCRGFYKGCILADLACKDACLQIGFFDHALQVLEKRRMVELFESFGPRVVTRSQYAQIVADQREGKLAFESACPAGVALRWVPRRWPAPNAGCTACHPFLLQSDVCLQERGRLSSRRDASRLTQFSPRAVSWEV